MSKFSISISDIIATVVVVTFVVREEFQMAIVILLCIAISELTRIRRSLETKDSND